MLSNSKVTSPIKAADIQSGSRPAVSPTKAYIACSKIKRMLVETGNPKAQELCFQLLDSPYRFFEGRVRRILIDELSFTELQAEHWITQNLKPN